MDMKKARELWMKPIEENRELLEKRAADTIEKHRKGFCKLRFVDKSGTPLKGKSVKITQQTHDFKYGANIFMLDEFASERDNRVYREAFKKYFNLATVPFYWNSLEPEQGKPRYDKNSPQIYRRPSPELCVEYCEENGIDAKLHCLVYENFLPDWLPKADMKAMEQQYEERFRQISERYSGRLYEVEVINELLCSPGFSGKSVISQRADVVPWAFELARRYFPNETLVINEASSIIDASVREYCQPYYLLVENALLKGASVNRIGLQHHDFRGSCAPNEEAYEAEVMRGQDMFDPAKLYRGLDIFASLGVPLEITEITIPTLGENSEAEELQADLLEALYTVCFGHEAIEAVVYWNLPDGYAYSSPTDSNCSENKCRAGLLHHDLTPKKSAERLWELFNKRWHTELVLTTDENGCVTFRGFYGDYAAEVDGATASFEMHKFADNCTLIEM